MTTGGFVRGIGALAALILVSAVIGAAPPPAQDEEIPELVLEELRAVRDEGEPIDDWRLDRLYKLVRDWEAEEPPGYEGPPWSEYLTVLRDVFRERDRENASSAIRHHAVSCDYYLALRLEHEGRRTAALETLRAASRHYGPKDYFFPLILISLADFERDDGRYRTALSSLHRARQVLDQGGPANDIAEVRPMLESAYGQTYLDMGITDVAAPFLRSAYEASMRIGNADLWAGSVYFLMLLAHDEGDFSEQRRLYEEFRSHPLHEQVHPDIDATLTLRLGFGRVEAEHRGEGEEGRAEEIVLGVLALPKLEPDEAVRAHIWLARSRLDRGEIDTARVAVDEALSWAKKLEADEWKPTNVDIAALETRLALASSAPAGELADLLERRMIPAYDAFLGDWASSPVREGGVGFLQFGRRHAVVSALVQLVLAVHGEGAGARLALEQLLRAQALGTLARENGLAAPTVDQVCAELVGGGRGVLCYLPGRERSHVFALDAGRCTHHELAASYDIQTTGVDLVAAIYGVLRADSPSQRATLDASLAATTARLIPDSLAARLDGWSSVVIVGLDSFGYVPFEALSSNGASMGTEKTVSYLPSLPVGLWLRERWKERGGPATGVLVYGGTGAPDAALESAGSLAPLVLDRAVLEAMIAPYPARATTLLAGPLGLDVLDDEAVRTSGIVHFVVHGLYRAERERPAGLLLDPTLGWKGVLFADAIEERRLGPDLALLTACGAGKARLRRGDDGRGHLGGAFFQSGSLAVVLSYTDLALEASVDLMGHCHGRLAAGWSVEAALTYARREVRPEQHGVHPIHSSLVHVLGLGELTFFPRIDDEEPPSEPAAESASFPWAGLGAVLATALLIVVVVLVVRRPRTAAG